MTLAAPGACNARKQPCRSSQNKSSVEGVVAVLLLPAVVAVAAQAAEVAVAAQAAEVAVAAQAAATRNKNSLVLLGV